MVGDDGEGSCQRYQISFRGEGTASGGPETPLPEASALAPDVIQTNVVLFFPNEAVFPKGGGFGPTRPIPSNNRCLRKLAGTQV